MPRLITLLLILAALVVLAMQNLATALPLVILSSETAAIPVGILLVGAICIGALITLILYGLVGLGRPPESKYRPMGKRVPYPDSPGSTTLPPSGPATGSTGPSYSSGVSAFVSDPPKDSGVKTSTKPASATPVKAPTVIDAPVKDSTPKGNTFSSGSDTQSSKTETNKGGGFRSHFGRRAPSAPIPDNSPASAPRTNIDEAPSVKKKTKRKEKKRKEEAVNRKIGDDWGDLRTSEHRNSWEMSEEERRQMGEPRGLFDFIKPGSPARESAGRLASDIAAGWGGQKGAQTSSPPSTTGYQDGYQDSYDQSYDGNYGPGPSYADSRSGNYQSGNYQSGNYQSSDYQSDGYRPANYDDLDQGWENFDDDVETPPNNVEAGKRVYGDSLYGEDSRDGGYGEGAYREEGYREERFPEDSPNEIGPDGVYEADYRVIVPPSKPLDDDSRDYDD